MRDTADLQRDRMVDRDLAGRGIKDLHTLEAMREVPREAFVPESLREFAYEDSPLPIEEGQTISQPYIVALMVQALELKGGEVILDVGTGSGYAAAVLSRIGSSVFSIERHGVLCEQARQRFEALGYDNIEVRHGDGTLGWAEHAPYDAIVVAAGGPEIPEPLLQQLKEGGRLVVPVGETMNEQRLVRVIRQGSSRFDTQSLGSVRFVPLVGEAGWHQAKPGGPATSMAVEHLIRETVEPLESIDDADLGGLIERVSGARVVLLGEATHGTSEFYDMRARITRELIEHHGFRIVAVEADWPDAARVDGYVRHRPLNREPEWSAFSRFPRWMWRNEELRTFTDWMHEYNEDHDLADRAAFYGLDLYSLSRSIDAVVEYLDEVDPAAASVARQRYGCLSPWERDPAVYGRAALTGSFQTCEPEVVRMLQDLLESRLDYDAGDGDSFLDAVQNARLVANAERYYRVMYYGARESWNLRDQHMFDTLMALLEFGGEESRAIVWAHNSHVGNAAATEMGTRGEHNIGQLCREKFGDDAVLIGFGTDHGTVAAASDWGGPVEIKDVRPSHPDSYEALFHAAGTEAFLLHLRNPKREEVRSELEAARLERAIGVIYRPETELQSHYLQASLPWQFDEYIWFDRTNAVKPLAGPARFVSRTGS